MDQEKRSLMNREDSVEGKTLTTTRAMEYLQAATSANTRRAYQSDIRHFMRWGGLLPTTPDTVIQYLQQHAEQLNPRTLVRRITALKNWHVYQNFTDPTSHPVVRKILSGIKNVHGKPKKKAPPLTIDTLSILVDHLEKSERLIDCRNNALLQIGFFGAFRRSEVVNIQWEHVKFVAEGVEILIPRSKTDQTGEGQICAIPYGDETLCPIAALKNWQKYSCSKSGFVFRQITVKNHLGHEAIKPNQLNIIIKSIAKACRLNDSIDYSSHSLRRGFATEASKNGATFNAIMRQGRWRHEGTVLGYIEESKRFEGNAAQSFFKKGK